MNRKQRDQNRLNALRLQNNLPCPQCGLPGRHFFAERPTTLQDVIDGTVPGGWWTCHKPLNDLDRSGVHPG